MTLKSVLAGLCLALAMALCLACGLFPQEPSFTPNHPQALGQGRPTCSTCHEDAPMKGSTQSFHAFDHTPSFLKNHRLAAGQNANVCASCHSQAFCADCHGGKTVLNPSVKLGNRPDRETPHRGNYMVQHRFDGKLDPTACYKCHGRANNQLCQTCHK